MLYNVFQPLNLSCFGCDIGSPKSESLAGRFETQEAKGKRIHLVAKNKMLFWAYGGMAQSVRALASHARGRWFESSCLHQIRPKTSFIVEG